ICLFAKSDGKIAYYCFKLGDAFGTAGIGLGGLADFMEWPNDAFSAFRVKRVVTLLNSHIAAISAPATDMIAMVDTDNFNIAPLMFRSRDVTERSEVRISSDERHLLQLNPDGKFYIFSTHELEPILSGVYIDDEVIVYTPAGFYDGT